MALTAIVLAPTVDASKNATPITVAAGSTATVGLYTAAGGGTGLSTERISITHLNPSGTYTDSGYALGGISDVSTSTVVLPAGVWNIDKPYTAVAVGVMVDQ